MAAMTIGEVAAKTGIRASALRFYEEAGILPAVPRVRGQRRYDDRLLKMVEVLGFAQRAGFTLAEIRTLFHGFAPDTPLGERWQTLADTKLRELDRLIAHAGQMKEAINIGMACGCIQLETCILGGAVKRPVDRRRAKGRRMR